MSVEDRLRSSFAAIGRVLRIYECDFSDGIDYAAIEVEISGELASGLVAFVNQRLCEDTGFGAQLAMIAYQDLGKNRYRALIEVVPLKAIVGVEDGKDRRELATQQFLASLPKAVKNYKYHKNPPSQNRTGISRATADGSNH